LALPLFVDCLRGLEHAHRLKVVHRDLKPGNILLETVGRRMTARIADFGLAKCFEQAGLSGMTATGICRGTYAFMPREQLTEFKYVRATSDIWSIAATFYHVLTGNFPRDFPPGRDPVEVILNDDCVPIRRRDPAIRASIAAVIDRALKPDPAQPFASAAEKRSAVEGLM
jgi:serine/threonine protein kinase